MMEKYFANYNQSLALKELGFDESCFGYYDGWNGQTHLIVSDEGSNRFLVKLFNLFRKSKNQTYNQDYVEYLTGICTAPLKSQVFEWFRKNYLLGHEINCPFVSYSGKIAEIKNEGRYELYITDEEQLALPEDIFYSTDYFEAESKAIDKLIKIVQWKEN